MKEFLFMFNDGISFIDIKAETLKTAISELSEKTGSNSEPYTFLDLFPEVEA